MTDSRETVLVQGTQEFVRYIAEKALRHGVGLGIAYTVHAANGPLPESAADQVATDILDACSMFHVETTQTRQTISVSVHTPHASCHVFDVVIPTLAP